MRIVHLFSAYISTVLASRMDVLNVTVTDQGLVIPFRNSQDPSEVVNVDLISQHPYSSFPIDHISRYPFIEDSVCDSLFGHEISISLNSPLGGRYRRAMLIPSRDDGFRLILGLEDPTDYCRRELVFAQFRFPLSFHSRVSLVSSPNRPMTPNIIATMFSRISLTSIDTQRQKDSIHPEVYDALMEELMILIGGELSSERQILDTLNFTSLIGYMPSIQYTIYRNGYDFEPVANIVLQPEDYITRQPDGRYELQVTRAEGRPNHDPVLGINFLRNVGVYINYNETEIGFCDPI